MVATLSGHAAKTATDAEVILASLTEPDVFAVLYDRYAAQLYRYAYRRLGSEAAEDAVAEAFADAFAGRKRYKPEYEDARPWLFGILTREIAGHRRREKTRYTTHVPEHPGAEGFDERVSADVTAQATRRELGRALAGLARGDRDVLLLIAWGQLSYEETAQALKIPIGTVRSRLSRARRKVRAALGDADPTIIVNEEPT
jgi:RNA polymerase sigma factor (sigma-70 family)